MNVAVIYMINDEIVDEWEVVRIFGHDAWMKALDEAEVGLYSPNVKYVEFEIARTSVYREGSTLFVNHCPIDAEV